MNRDIESIFDGYKEIINEQVAAPAAGNPVQDVKELMGQVESSFAQGPGQDVETLQSQVQMLNTAQQAINPAIMQTTKELEQVKDQAAQGIPVEQHIDPSTGTYRQESAIQMLNQQYTRLSQLAQSVQEPAQQMGVDISVLMESIQTYIDYIKDNAEIVTEAICAGMGEKAAQVQNILIDMLKENAVPDIHTAIDLAEEEDEDSSADPNYLRDVLGYEPEDFEHEDPDQAAMDRQDAVELAKHDRPSAGPEDGLMGDVEALERLLDDETRAVMDDEGGAMSRREAREIAKDIIKQMIDRL